MTARDYNSCLCVVGGSGSRVSGFFISGTEKKKNLLLNTSPPPWKKKICVQFLFWIILLKKKTLGTRTYVAPAYVLCSLLARGGEGDLMTLARLCLERVEEFPKRKSKWRSIFRWVWYRVATYNKCHSAVSGLFSCTSFSGAWVKETIRREFLRQKPTNS